MGRLGHTGRGFKSSAGGGCASAGCGRAPCGYRRVCENCTGREVRVSGKSDVADSRRGGHQREGPRGPDEPSTHAPSSAWCAGMRSGRVAGVTDCDPAFTRRLISGSRVHGPARVCVYVRALTPTRMRRNADSAAQ